MCHTCFPVNHFLFSSSLPPLNMFGREEVLHKWYCVILWPVTITPLNYVSSFCLVKSILTKRDLGEGAAAAPPTDIFHRHLWQMYKMWTDERRHQGSGGFRLYCFFFLHSINSLRGQRSSHIQLKMKCQSQFHPLLLTHCFQLIYCQGFK